MNFVLHPIEYHRYSLKQKVNDDINKKHLHILINSMTYSGDIKPVTRYGIDVEQAGVLAKASFELFFEVISCNRSFKIWISSL